MIKPAYVYLNKFDNVSIFLENTYDYLGYFRFRFLFTFRIPQQEIDGLFFLN